MTDRPAQTDTDTDTDINPAPHPIERHDPAAPLRVVLGAMAMQIGTSALKKAVDSALGHPPDTSSAAAHPQKPAQFQKPLAKKLAAIAVTSVPGAAVVVGGLLAKYIFDRGGQRRQAQRMAALADRQLQAED